MVDNGWTWKTYCQFGGTWHRLQIGNYASRSAISKMVNPFAVCVARCHEQLAVPWVLRWPTGFYAIRKRKHLNGLLSDASIDLYADRYQTRPGWYPSGQNQNVAQSTDLWLTLWCAVTDFCRSWERERKNLPRLVKCIHFINLAYAWNYGGGEFV